jgi:hypothetical protein
VEAHPLTVEKAFIIGRIELLIGQFGENFDPEFIFKEILKLIDEHKIAEHKEIMIYFYELLATGGFTGGFIEYADELAKKYNLQITKD